MVQKTKVARKASTTKAPIKIDGEKVDVKVEGGKKTKNTFVPPSPEKQEEFTKLAISTITAALKDEGAKVQANGQPCIPKDWRLKFKPVLGPYKKFVLSQSSFRVLAGSGESYTIHLNDGSALPALNIPEREPWQREVAKAWRSYCLARPDAKKRSVDEFMKPADAPKHKAKEPAVVQAEKEMAVTQDQPKKKARKKI
uniref:Uncharacterized protein n=1 Tax=Noctiluca scintillans TaxID=2966 RepID=A0A7S1AIC6_NOCSC|mmetsp:Transcript_46706/g.123955  ORF Transcript_46706/g.123955 Transcript_46706/m.123955 type:complete len:198 (+) Transcript_46706:83-676(+)